MRHRFILKKKNSYHYYCSLNNSEFTSSVDKADRFTKKQAENFIKKISETLFSEDGDLEIKEIKTIIL